jgi:predicted NAD/FAD-binding protein
LSCGWLLSDSNNVTLFEKHPTIGMDASSIDLELDSDISGLGKYFTRDHYNTINRSLRNLIISRREESSR